MRTGLNTKTMQVYREQIKARQFVEDFDAMQANGGPDCPCVHGHFGCSTHNGGPCLDETLARFPELAR
jgi:hypothetical protein